MEAPFHSATALPLLTMLALLTVGGLFLPIGAELLVFIMFIAAAVAGVIAIRQP